jgi:cytochrome c oxidase subunit 2
MSPRQSALDAAGRHARSIEHLWWFFLALLGTVFIIVMILALFALVRRQPAGERAVSLAVTGGTAVTVLILFALIVVSVITGKSISSPGDSSPPLVVDVIASQWWWHFRYENDDPSRMVVTANELHIPVGRPVLIRGTSLDVIHSFWAPNLQGKRDLIPSRVTYEYLEADQPGRFRGQCAEFCGLEHAKMALWIVAETPAQFQAWTKNQLLPSAAPDDPDKQRGLQVFLAHACVFCHNIEGTPAHGQVGPDLTHLASRSTIAAGTLPNNKGNLAGWIADPQRVKPGNHMATVPLAAVDMQPLLDYLESLQ